MRISRGTQNTVMLISFLKKQYYALISRELEGMETVLDVGCGESSIVQRVSNRKKFHSTGVDAYPPSIEASRTLGIHDDYLVADITKLEFPPASFDAVISVDVVEHFEKDVALRMLEKMESWAKKKVIIVTPNGWSPAHLHEGARQDELTTSLMRHKCGWTVDDFKRRGYRVRGMKGFRRLIFHTEKGHAIYAYEEKKIRKLLYDITSAITYPVPRLAFQLLAIKDINKNPA